MSLWTNGLEFVDEEVRELIQNYKNKKATVYEPCTLENIKECLIGLCEELGQLNVNYMFNPHTDIENNTLVPNSLINLINSTWTLLHYHKCALEKAEILTEQNHTLEQSNKKLNGTVSQLKDTINIEKNEARACVASSQRVSDQSDAIHNKLTETTAKLTKLNKQKESKEKCLQNEINRLKLENEKLLDKLRNKSGTYTSCSEVCDSTLLSLKEREKRHRSIIAQLQANNQELLQEVIAMKEELVIAGLQDLNIPRNY